MAVAPFAVVPQECYCKLTAKLPTPRQKLQLLTTWRSLSVIAKRSRSLVLSAHVLQVSFTSGNRQRRPWLDSPQTCLKSQLVRKGSNHMSYITRVRSYTCPVSRLPCVKRVLSHTCTETRLSHLVSLLYCATSVLSNAYKRFTPDCVTPKM